MTLRRFLLLAATTVGLITLWRDIGPRGTDGLTHRQRRYHARQWANGSGRMPTALELATFREHPHTP